MTESKVRQPRRTRCQACNWLSPMVFDFWDDHGNGARRKILCPHCLPDHIQDWERRHPGEKY